jgi:alkylation response protein AidB-like acyl-CoA dehydrogenase
LTYLANNQGVLAVLQHALEFPQLQFSNIQTFRQQLASGLQRYSTVHNSVFLGAQAATPGMAFLAGYQNAIRCLDVDCPRGELAAFCVSEKGVKKPWDMMTRIAPSADDYVLDGQKGYVMLLPSELDRMYVIAKNTADQFCCLYLSANSPGVFTTDRLSAPFVEDIPHAGVRFDGVHISSEQLLAIDGHQQANKPFRYWEDVHVALAMMAWMLRELAENKCADDMVALISQLTEQFKQQPDYYSLQSISLLDKSHELMDSYGQYLPEGLQKLWLKDKLLLQMGQKIRHLVRTKLIQS